MTRFEKIKSLDIDEISDYLGNAICEIIDDCPGNDCTCHQCVVRWLQQEVESDGRN